MISKILGMINKNKIITIKSVVIPEKKIGNRKKMGSKLSAAAVTR